MPVRVQARGEADRSRLPRRRHAAGGAGGGDRSRPRPRGALRQRQRPALPRASATRTRSSPGQPVQVIGFPLGRAVEVGRPVTAETVPQPTVTRGSIGALRDERGGRRALHPDRRRRPSRQQRRPHARRARGYAVGVIRMRLGARTSIGPRLRDPHQPREGLPRVQQPRARLPHRPPAARTAAVARLEAAPLPGAGRRSTTRRPRACASEWAPPQEVALLVERVASPLDPGATWSGRSATDTTFPAFGADRGRREPRRPDGRPVGARRRRPGHDRGGSPVRRSVTRSSTSARRRSWPRTSAPPAQVAFNRSVLDGWLASLEADPLLTREVAAPVTAALEPVALPIARPTDRCREAWYREPAEPTPCGLLPAPDAVLLASPEGDFTVSLRAAWWRRRAYGRARGAGPARACRSPDAPAAGVLCARPRAAGRDVFGRGPLPAPPAKGSCSSRVSAPLAKQPYVRELFAAWTRAIAGQ